VEDNIKIDIEETINEDINWVYLVQNSAQWPTLVKEEINLPLPSDTTVFLTVCCVISWRKYFARSH